MRTVNRGFDTSIYINRITLDQSDDSITHRTPSQKRKGEVPPPDKSKRHKRYRKGKPSTKLTPDKKLCDSDHKVDKLKRYASHVNGDPNFLKKTVQLNNPKPGTMRYTGKYGQTHRILKKQGPCDKGTI